MTSPKVCLEARALHGALAGRQCQERAVQTRRSLLFSLLRLRPHLPSQRGIGLLQNATARQPGTKQGTPLRGQGHQTLQEGEAGLHFLSFEQNILEECIECSQIMNPLITNGRCLVLGFPALPTSAQFTGGFGFVQGNTMPL